MKCLWVTVDSNRITKIKYIDPYQSKIRPTKVEYSTASGVYYNTLDVKVYFFIIELSIRKVIIHRFIVNYNEGDTVIGYNIIIGHDLMVQLVLVANFKQILL